LKNNIFISTLAFNEKSINDISNIAKKNNFSIEFTSNLKYYSSILSDFFKADITKSVHNYFPPPKDDFVLNLASKNKQIRTRSINHCVDGLKISDKINSEFYAAHAGFCIDPNVTELGNKININSNFEREEHKSIFINSIMEILEITNDLNVNFFIENNVITRQNMHGEINPLLCCESSEINWLFNKINNPRFGFLLDTAHLKVSCETICRDVDNEFIKISSFVKAIHHSDNDGKIDNNMPISNEYWFLKYLKNYKDIFHTIEVKNLDEINIINQINILNKEWK
jgi:sugar phosphate isomerase/epimerase